MTHIPPLTIGLDATPLTVATGGVARYTWELARALALHHPQDTYWLFSDQPLHIDRLPGTVPPNLRTGTGPTSAAERRWWLWGVHKEMKRRGVRLFHGTDFSVPYLGRNPAVMTVHDLSPWPESEPSLNRSGVSAAQSRSGREKPTASVWQPGADRIRKRTPRLLKLGLATMVVTPSEAIRRAVMRKFELPGDRVVATPLAADIRFTPEGAGPTGALGNQLGSRPYLLFVGTLEPRKNIERLVRAWEEVRQHHEVNLVLAGRRRSDFTFEVPEQLRSQGLHMLGAVPEDALPALYRGAAAVVYPSLYEGFGLPVLEAMQSGAVVITSLDPAICEVTGVSHEEHRESDPAIHVDARDHAALSRAMRSVLEHPEQFQTMRQQAIRRAGEFSWENTARRTRQVYEEALQRFRRSNPSSTAAPRELETEGKEAKREGN